MIFQKDNRVTLPIHCEQTVCVQMQILYLLLTIFYRQVSSKTDSRLHFPQIFQYIENYYHLTKRILNNLIHVIENEKLELTYNIYLFDLEFLNTGFYPMVIHQHFTFNYP